MQKGIVGVTLSAVIFKLDNVFIEATFFIATSYNSSFWVVSCFRVLILVIIISIAFVYFESKNKSGHPCDGGIRTKIEIPNTERYAQSREWYGN